MEITQEQSKGQQLLALNPQGTKMGTAVTHTLDSYRELIRQPWLTEMVSQIRQLSLKQKELEQGSAEADSLDKQIGRLKKQLPFRAAHYYHFVNDHRSQQSIDPEAFTFQTTVDIDEPSEVEGAIKSAFYINRQEGNPWQGQVLHIERSARNKVHIDIRIPLGYTIAEAQNDFCRALGVTPDESCCSPERIIFITDADSELYTSDDWYRLPTEEELEARREAYRKRGLTIDGRQQPGAASMALPAPQSAGPDSPSAAAPQVYETEYEGVPYEEITKALTDLMGGAPAHGSRNNFILSMASLLRYICNNEPEWIKQVIPLFGENRERVFATVDNACRLKKAAAMPNIVKRAVDLARKQMAARKAIEKAGFNDDVPPAMPAKLPRLIRLLVKNVPDDFKPAVANAVFPALAAHLKGVTFRDLDNKVGEAALTSLLMAPMSSGKSLVDDPINCIIEDIVKRDEESREREQAWKEEVTSLGNSKDKPTRPEGLCVQVVSPDMTRAAYIMRLDEAQKAGGAYLFCNLSEVDSLRKFNSDPSLLIRLCWDNAEDGQERVGANSVTARVKTRFNWSASTTIALGQRFFNAKRVADGSVSRICMSTVIRPDFAPRPVVGDYDDKYHAVLRPFIANLNKAYGEIVCKKAHIFCAWLDAGLKKEAELADSKPYAEFAKRAVVNGHRKAMVLYIANGCKWEKSIENFIAWSVRYDLWCKMRFFGKQMADSIADDKRLVNHGGIKNLATMVHDTFTYDELHQLCLALGKDSNLWSLLSVWQKRGHVVKNPDGTYSKTEKFFASYGHYVEAA